MVRPVLPLALRETVRAQFVDGRRLDHGNPSPANLRADFLRFGIKLWEELKTLDPGHGRRLDLLERLMQWRNAIAHQDFDPAALRGRSRISLAEIRLWRRACGALARSCDEVVARRLVALTGTRPW